MNVYANKASIFECLFCPVSWLYAAIVFKCDSWIAFAAHMWMVRDDALSPPRFSQAHRNAAPRGARTAQARP